MERIYIKEARRELGNICWRTLKKWCALNDVAILSDLGNRKKYLLRFEFENAKKKNADKYLAQKYGTTDFPENSDQAKHISAQSQTVNSMIVKKYKPMGPVEVGFFSELQQII